MSVMRNGRESMSVKAYRAIKDMILRGELKQGELVSEGDLLERLEMGRTPVREAILRLARDRLITVHPRKGIEITPVSLKTVRDIFEIRAILEPAAIVHAISKIDRRRLAEIRARFAERAELETPIPHDVSVGLAELDDRFHMELVETMGNQYATGLMRSFMDNLTIIRSAVTEMDAARFRESNDEHMRIIDAILEGDADLARELLAEHIRVSYIEAMRTLIEL